MNTYLKKMMILLTILTVGTFSVTVEAFSLCEVSDIPDENSAQRPKFTVTNDSGKKIGYVQKIDEVTWTIWLAGEGATNYVYREKMSAVDELCSQAQKNK